MIELESVAAADAAAITAMRYPIQGSDGRWFDRALPYRGQRDPWYDACPPWCDGDHAHMESMDADRCHFGPRIAIPIRSVMCESEWDGGPGNDGDHRSILGTVELYLQRRVLEREPTIWLGKGESGNGVRLSVDEAVELGRLLLELASEGRVKTDEAASAQALQAVSA